MIDTFAGLLEGLARHRVRFALVGGLAAALNGHLRTTRDVDILIDNSAENVGRLAACLGEFGEGLGRDLRPDEVPNEPGAIRISERFDLDVFAQMSGKSLADFASLIRQHTLPSGAVIDYLNAEGLIETKRGSVREKDQIDIQVLRNRQLAEPESSFPFDTFRDSTPPDEDPPGQP